jgi:hypothetical protein
MILGNENEEGHDFSKFLIIPDEEEERYEAYYNATSTDVLLLQFALFVAARI